MPTFRRLRRIFYLGTCLTFGLLLTGCWFTRPKTEERPRPESDSLTISERVKTETPASEPRGYEIPRAELQPTSEYDGPIVDNASFDYPYWVELVTGKISRSLHLSHVRDRNLTCKIFFQVNRGGELVALRMVSSSRSSAFDKACLEAIQWAEPFPPLPADYQNDRIGLTVPFKSK